MMLQHRGRTTGRRRYVALEVLDRGPGWLIVVSGYGPSSPWYRNVITTPAVRIWSGRLKDVPARAESIPAAEAATLLANYRKRHRRAAKALGRTLDIPELTADAPIPADNGTKLPLIRITPDH
jgi:deazaflavin-dependent oxidoreductase (nitroreductase family)